MNKQIVIIDYGSGNLHSVSKAVTAIGADPLVTSDPQKIAAASKIILPGVGAFGDCMHNLQSYHLEEVILQALQAGKPFLGICLGLQLLFEGSEETPGVAGLGFFKGNITKIVTPYKIPHMGWNKLELRAASPLLIQVSGEYVYFVHSYHAQPLDKGVITAVCDYGQEVVASVGRDNVQAVQFHPEKSSSVGLKILQAFKEWQP